MVKLIIHDYQNKQKKKKTDAIKNNKIIILTNPLSLIVYSGPHTQCSIKVSFKIWIILIYILMQSILFDWCQETSVEM